MKFWNEKISFWNEIVRIWNGIQKIWKEKFKIWNEKRCFWNAIFKSRTTTMKTCFLIIFLFCFGCVKTFAQRDSLEESIWKSWNKLNKGSHRAVNNYKINPIEEFGYSKPGNYPYFIVIIYKKVKFYQFLIVDNKVAIISSCLIGGGGRRLFANDYYFYKDSLVSEHIRYKDSLNLDGLLGMYRFYKAKADKL